MVVQRIARDLFRTKEIYGCLKTMQEKPVEREQIVAKDLITKRARPGKARMNEAKGSDIENSLEMRRDR